MCWEGGDGNGGQREAHQPRINNFSLLRKSQVVDGILLINFKGRVTKKEHEGTRRMPVEEVPASSEVMLTRKLQEEMDVVRA